MLSRSQRQELLDAGFSVYEVGQLAQNLADKPQDFRLSAKPWQDAMWRRMNFWRRERKAGKTHNQIIRKINRRYVLDDEISIWTFVKSEYNPPPPIQDYREAQRQRARQKAMDLYGTRRMPRRR